MLKSFDLNLNLISLFIKNPELFAPCIKKNTRILNLMNGLGIDEKIAKLLPQYPPSPPTV